MNRADESKRLQTGALLALLGVVWFGLHIPAIQYGTADTPLHTSYLTADEQSPINGALHVLQSKSILGLQNQTTLYYGPVLAMLAVPAVLADFAYRYVVGEISVPMDYKDFVVWHWGGALAWARLIAVLAGYLGILALYYLFNTRTINPARDSTLPWIAVVLLASNYLYFEYSGAFRHWVFMLALLLWQLVVLVWVLEREEKRTWLWVAHSVLAVCAFGISYLGLLYQVFWIPVLYMWWRQRAWNKLKEFGYHVGGILVGAVLIILWHPYGFMRTFGLFRFVSNAPSSSVPLPDVSRVSTIIDSFLYFAHVIFINNIALVLAGLLIGISYFSYKSTQSKVLLLVPVLPACANYVFFSTHAHNESRYMLLTVGLGVVAVLIAYAQIVRIEQAQRNALPVIRTLLLIAIGVGLVQSAGFIRMMVHGPIERATVVPWIQAWQEQQPNTKTLVIKDWPLGYVHTKSAYEDYILRFHKSEYDLWKFIRASEAPPHMQPLNVYYLPRSESVSESDLATYDHVVVHNPPLLGTGIAPESPRDIYDVYPWTVWNFEAYQESYTVIK